MKGQGMDSGFYSELDGKPFGRFSEQGSDKTF